VTIKLKSITHVSDDTLMNVSITLFICYGMLSSNRLSLTNFFRFNIVSIWENRALTPYFSGDKIEKFRWAGHVARMGEKIGVYRALVGKPEEKRPLWRPRHGWEDNIKMDLQEVGMVGMDWIELVRDKDRWRELVSAVINASGSIKCGEFLD